MIPNNLRLKIILIISFILCFFASEASAELLNKAEMVREKLQPIILSLYPESRLGMTQLIESRMITTNVSFYRFNYVLTNVKDSISEQNLEEYNQKFDEFLRWVGHWPEFSESMGLSRRFPFKKYARAGSSKVIPRLKYTFSSDDAVYSQLIIDFVKRDDDVLIVMCSLLITLPASVDSDLSMHNVSAFLSKRPDKKYDCHITFDLVNDSKNLIKLATGALWKSEIYYTWTPVELSLYYHSVMEVSGKPFPAYSDLKIVDLKPGESF